MIKLKIDTEIELTNEQYIAELVNRELPKQKYSIGDLVLFPDPESLNYDPADREKITALVLGVSYHIRYKSYAYNLAWKKHKKAGLSTGESFEGDLCPLE